jgi:hypothetical protein
MSPNYDGTGSAYGDGEECVISVSGDVGPIAVQDFSTEGGYDKLTVNAIAYSGQAGPEGVVPSGEITWTSDYSVTSSGWKICFGGPH